MGAGLLFSALTPLSREGGVGRLTEPKEKEKVWQVEGMDLTGTEQAAPGHLRALCLFNTLIPFRRQMGVKVNYFFRP